MAHDRPVLLPSASQDRVPPAPTTRRAAVVRRGWLRCWSTAMELAWGHLDCQRESSRECCRVTLSSISILASLTYTCTSLLVACIQLCSSTHTQSLFLLSVRLAVVPSSCRWRGNVCMPLRERALVHNSLTRRVLHTSKCCLCFINRRGQLTAG